MNPDRVRDLLEAVRRGELDPDAALEQLARLPFVDVPDARVDTHRTLRMGLPEVVFAPGKTPQQIADIATALREAGQNVLVTRVEAAAAEEVCGRLGAGEYDAGRAHALDRAGRGGDGREGHDRGGLRGHRRPAGGAGGGARRALFRQQGGAARRRRRGGAAPAARRERDAALGARADRDRGHGGRAARRSWAGSWTSP